jgi:thiol-disulfide isomerase/thioredoxin
VTAKQPLARGAPRLSRRRQLAIVFALAALIAVGAGLYVGYARIGGGSAIGRDAGALLGLTLPDVAGKPQPLAQWRGKVLVVNFWATWCAPCRDEMPQFMQLQRDLGANGVQFVGIAADSADKVAQFADELHLNYPALIGGYGAIELSGTLGNSLMALPFTVVVDRGGRIAHTQLGPLPEAKLRTILGGLLQQAPS